MIQRSDVLVVIPAWNEAASIGEVINSVKSAGFPVLVVDDGSSDSTLAIARRAGIHTLQLPFNLGVGGALRLGFKFAISKGYSAVVQVDADGQHSSGDIDKLLSAANQFNADMIIGSRFLGSQTTMDLSKLRRLAMWILARNASKATCTNLTDTTSGFRLIRQPLLNQFAQCFPVNYLGDTFEAVVSAGRAGYRVIEISTEIRNRRHGHSSASTWQATKFTFRAIVVAMFHLQPRLEPKQSAKSEDERGIG